MYGGSYYGQSYYAGYPQTVTPQQKYLQDTMILSENYSRIIQQILHFIENIVIADIKVLSGIRRIMEYINLNEVFITKRIYNMVYTEIMNLLDVRRSNTERDLTESIVVTDAVVKTPKKGLLESIHLSESIVKHASIVRTSIVLLSERFIRRLNGMIINWVKRARAFSDWTKRVVGIDTMTKRSRATVSFSKRSHATESFSKRSKANEDWTKIRGINDCD